MPVGIPDGKYPGRKFDCRYGFSVTPKQCEVIQTSKPIELIKNSLCFECEHSAIEGDVPF